jgi:hypothetical protein
MSARWNSRAAALASAEKGFLCLKCGKPGPIDTDGTAWLPNCSCAPESDTSVYVHCDSAIERDRGAELSRLQRAGVIHSLRCHPRFDLVVNGIKVGVYESDWSYTEANEAVIEEIKPSMRDGWETRDPLAALKIRLFRAIYPTQRLDVLER